MSPVTSVLGIDVAKSKLDVVLLGRTESPKHAVFDKTQAGFLKLEKWLNTSEVHELHACLEATGMYGEALAQFLSNREYQVSIVKPARIKAYAYRQLIRSKIDKLDAQVIADFCLNQHPDR